MDVDEVTEIPTEVQHSPPTRTEDEALQRVFQDKFFERVVHEYARDPQISQLVKQMNLTRDTEGLLWTAQQQLVVPDGDSLREACIESVHSHPYCGHFGVNRTTQKAKQIYYWPNLPKSVHTYVTACDSCQRVKALRQKPMGKLQQLPIPERRWDDVSMDYIVKLPVTPAGNDSIWVVVDRLTKMVHLQACKETITGEQTALLYEKEIFRLHGIPKSIVSDRDTRFTGSFWKAMNKRFGTRLRMSSKHHPQTDGQTENANGVLEDALRHFVGPYQNDWDTHLPAVEFAMNNAWNESIQNTPFMLNYGQHPNDPTLLEIRERNPAVNRFVGKWSKQLTRAKQCLRAAQDRYKASADKRRREPPDYQPGDEVLLKTSFFKLATGFTPKLAPRWVGPFKVLNAVGPYKLAYKLELPQVIQRTHPVFHVSALRPYLRTGPYQPPPIPEFIDNDLEYEVAYVSDTREWGKYKTRQYRVCWEGFPDQDTWEPLSMLTHCTDKIRAYWLNRGTPCPHALPTDG